MKEGSEKFLLFNFKTRLQVMIKLEGDKVRDLGRGPYLFELKIHDPQYKKSEYRADLITAKLCDPKEVVRFVNGELSGVR
jgi:hypothetical protein